MVNDTRLNVELAKQFAWLLRPDLRSKFVGKEEPGFEEWWMIKGRQEFPGWLNSLTQEQVEKLFATSSQTMIAGVKIDVPNVVTLIEKYRPDAVKEFAKNGNLHVDMFFAWVIVKGLTEHALIQFVPRSLIRALDQPVERAKSEARPEVWEQTVPTATLLMYLLWSLMDESTQRERNIFTEQGRLAFIGWFFSVLGKLGLESLLAGRWIPWLHSSEGATALATQKNKVTNLTWLVPKDPHNQGVFLEKPFGVNLYGFAYGELGIGEDLRMAVECCETAGIPYHVVNVDAGNIRQADLHLKGKVSDGTKLPPYSINIFCLPAFDTVSRVFMQRGSQVFEGYHNIGWWPWELAVFPKAWKPYAFELVDEVWASSQFLYEMYKKSTNKPVKLVPLAVSVDRMKSYPRKHFDLPEKKYLFLFIFDFNSSVSRKNPIALVKAFKAAFKSDDNTVALVFKTMNTNINNNEWQLFLEECNKDKRIKIITKTLDRPEVLGLINTCDAYVSLHRCEGFGRTLAEAILLGKKVVATGYSGNVDYMNYPECHSVDYKLVEGPVYDYFWMTQEDNAVWADVNINSAAEIIKTLKINENNENNENKKINKFEKFQPKYISQIMLNNLI
jgi:glycosyltransferase involved in cell wall biosynthesis